MKFKPPQAITFINISNHIIKIQSKILTSLIQNDLMEYKQPNKKHLVSASNHWRYPTDKVLAGTKTL